MTIGTVLGLLLLKLCDSRWVLITFATGAMISLGAALFGAGETALLAFPMVGFFSSVMWSVLISLALNSVTAHHGTLTGILITGIVGGAVWPLLIGFVGDLFDLKTGMMLLFLSLAYILIVGCWADPLVSNKRFEFRNNRPCS